MDPFSPFSASKSPHNHTRTRAQVVEKTPEPAWARARRGKKRKAAAGGGKEKGGKSRKTEEKLPALNPDQIMEAHPVRLFAIDVHSLCV